MTVELLPPRLTAQLRIRRWVSASSRIGMGFVFMPQCIPRIYERRKRNLLKKKHDGIRYGNGRDKTHPGTPFGGAYFPPENNAFFFEKCVDNTIRRPHSADNLRKGTDRAEPGNKKRRWEMKLSICKYNPCSGGSKKWSLVTRKTAPYKNWKAYARLNCFGFCLFFNPGHGISLGDSGYYKSYADCPSICVKTSRWIAFRTGALPCASRPYAE